jgi:hypothetical protein
MSKNVSLHFKYSDFGGETASKNNELTHEARSIIDGLMTEITSETENLGTLH